MSEGNVYRFGQHEIEKPDEVAKRISETSGRLVVATLAAPDVHDAATHYGALRHAGHDKPADETESKVVESLDAYFPMLPNKKRSELRNSFSRTLRRPNGDRYFYTASADDMTGRYLAALVNEIGDKQAEVVDPSVAFDHSGVDHRKSRDNAQNILDDLELRMRHSAVIVPSGYGHEKRRSGSILRSLGRKGADRSGALFAAQAGWDYTVWSSRKSGVHSADPDVVHNASLVSEVTRSEMRAIRSALFSHRMISDLSSSELPVYLRNMLAPNSEGTRIVSHERATDPRRPAVLIAGEPIDAIHVYENGMGDKPGKAIQMLEVFAKRSISNRCMPGNDDNQSFIFSADEVRKDVAAVIQELSQISEDVEFDELAMLHIAGQPMTDPWVKMQVQQKADQILRDNNIIVRDHETGLNTNYPSPGMSFLFAREGLERAIKVTHEAFIERDNPLIGFM